MTEDPAARAHRGSAARLRWRAGEAVVGQLAEVWGSVADACASLDPSRWARGTDCPGWTVKDQLSHLIGIERILLGDPAPPELSEWPAHVKNEFGALNESWVQARRGVPGEEVLAEFVEAAGRRLDALADMSSDQFDQVGWSPVGQVPYREFMETRVLDSWAHEQDIRRALDRPGGRNGAGEAVVLDRSARAMPYAVGKRVAPRTEPGSSSCCPARAAEASRCRWPGAAPRSTTRHRMVRRR